MDLLKDEVINLICDQARSVVEVEREIYEKKVQEKMTKLLKEKNIDSNSWRQFLPPNY